MLNVLPSTLRLMVSRRPLSRYPGACIPWRCAGGRLRIRAPSSVTRKQGRFRGAANAVRVKSARPTKTGCMKRSVTPSMNFQEWARGISLFSYPANEKSAKPPKCCANAIRHIQKFCRSTRAYRPRSRIAYFEAIAAAASCWRPMWRKPR